MVIIISFILSTVRFYYEHSLYLAIDVSDDTLLHDVMCAGENGQSKWPNAVSDGRSSCELGRWPKMETIKTRGGPKVWPVDEESSHKEGEKVGYFPFFREVKEG